MKGTGNADGNAPFGGEGEFQVNTGTADDQAFPAVAGLAGGDFVIVWMSYGQDGDLYGVHGRLYDAAGNAAGDEFQINASIAGDQVSPIAAALAGGGFVVVWTSDGQDGGGYGVYGRRYGAGGEAAGGEFLVNATIADNQHEPSVAGLEGGGFVVAWMSYDQDGGGYGIYARLYDAEGDAAGGELPVNSSMEGDQLFPCVAPLEGGGFVVIWVSDGQDGGGYGVYGRRYDSDGNGAAVEFPVNGTTADNQHAPSVAGLEGGGFVVAWMSYDQDGGGYGIYARLFDAAGEPAGGEFLVNASIAGDQISPAVAGLDGGCFVVTWTSDGQDGSGYGVYARHYGADGAAAGGELLVNASTADNQQEPAISSLAGGGFVAAWMSYDQDGSGYGVFGQRFAVAPPTVDLNGGGEGIDFAAAFTEGGAGVAIADGDVSIDAGSGEIASATIAVTDALAGDALTLSGQLPAGIVATGEGGATLTLAGIASAADYRLALAQVRYASASEDPAAGGADPERTIVVTVNDGSADSAPAAATVAMASVNDSPMLAATAANPAFTAGDAPVDLFHSVTISAVEIQQLLDMLVFTVTGLSDGENERIFADGESITLTDGNMLETSSNGFTAAVSVSGTIATVTLRKAGGVPSGALAALVDTMAYANHSAAPTGGTRTVTLAAVRDTGGTAYGGADTAPLSISSAIAVAGANEAPVANDDTLAATEDIPVTWSADDLIGNDSDAEGDILTITAVANAVGGTVALGEGGATTFTPDSDFTGAASFDYTIGDGNGGFDTATATVDVGPVNDAPTITITLPQGAPLGGETRVNTNAGGSQGQSSAAALPDGGYVVAWRHSTNQGGSDSDIYARRYDAAGVALGGEVRVNAATTVDQFHPSVVALAGGGWVVVWESYDGIYARRFDASGVAQGAEIRVLTSFNNEEMHPAVAALADGGFVVGWHFSNRDGSGTAIVAQRYDASGTAQGGQIQVNTTSANDQEFPSLAALADGGYVVTWTSWQQDAPGSGVYARRYDASGAAQGGEFRINTTVAGHQQQASAAALTGGGYVVVWQSSDIFGGGAGVYAQRFDAANAPQGGETSIGAISGQSEPFVTALADGGYVVTWASAGEIYARRYDAAGVAQGGAALVNTSTDGQQWEAAAAGLSGGGYVVTWNTLNQGGPAPPGVYAQRFGEGFVATEQFVLFLNNNIAIGDVDSADGTISVTLAVGSGVIDVIAGNGGATVSGSGTASVTITGTLAQVNALLGASSGSLVGYTPNSDTPPPSTMLTISVADNGNTGSGGPLTAVATETIAIRPVSDAPSGTDATRLILEDGTHIFSETDFGFSDVEGNAFVGVRFTAAPTGGTLYYDADGAGGAAPAAIVHFGSTTYSAADIAAGRLTFVPTANLSGTGAGIVRFAVVDDGASNLFGRNVDQSANRVTFDIAPVNDPPSGKELRATIDEDTPHVLALANLGYTDIEGHAALNVIVVTAPTKGTLFLDADGAGGTDPVALEAGAVIAVADIVAGRVTYLPPPNGNGVSIPGYDRLYFRLQDDGGTANGGVDVDPTPNFFTWDVRPVNDSPVLTGSATDATHVEGGGPTPVDAGLGFVDVDSTSFSVVARFSQGTGQGDYLTFVNTDAALYGTIAGTWNESQRQIQLLGTGTVAQWQNALRAVSYDTTSENPNNFARQVTFSVHDGSAGPSAMTSLVRYVNVTPVNDVPVANADSATTREDTPLQFTQSQLTGNDSDAEGNSLTIVGVSNPVGGTVVLGGPNGWPLFTPAANFVGAASFDYTVSDGNGGTATATVTVNVTPVNDAPSGTSCVVTMAEDGVHVFSGSDFGFTDAADTNTGANSLLSVWFHTVPSAGTLLYDHDGDAGTAGIAVHAWSEIPASHIDAGRLTFRPAAEASGAAYASFAFQVRDDGGTAEGGVNLDSTPNSFTFDVTAVDDLPIISISDLGATEQAGLDLSGAVSVTDSDAGGGIFTVSLSVDYGILTATAGNSGATVGGSGTNTVNLIGTLVQIRAVLAGGAGSTLVYTANTDAPPASAELIVTINGGGIGGNPVATGIETIEIAAVNDAPTVSISPAGTIPYGDEFKVNTVTVGDQSTPAVAGFPGGGFVVTWRTSGPVGTLNEVQAQLYDASGVPQGAEFRVNSYVTNPQEAPAVAALSGGGFVVTWTSFGQDGSSYGIYAQRFSASGVAEGGEFRVNSTTAGGQFGSDVAALSGGGFVITWDSPGIDGSGNGVYAQRYDASGVPQGGEFPLHAFTDNDQSDPAVAALPGGGFVVVWESYLQDGDGLGLFAQRYDASGVRQGAEFQVNSFETGDQFEPAVGALTGGGFVISWWSRGQDGSADGIYAQLHDASGAAQGGEFRVNSTVADFQIEPAIVALADGGFVVTWSSRFQDGSGYGVYAQRYDASGAALGGEFRVNGHTSGDQILTAMAALADGGFLVSWISQGQDGSGQGIYAQRYSADHTYVFATLEQTALNLKGSVSVGDADAGSGAVTVTLSVDHGVLTVTAGGSGAGVSGSGTGTVILTGTLAQVRALLGSDTGSTVTYTPDTDNPPAQATLGVTVDDGGGTGSGGALAADDSATIAILSVNDAPSVTSGPSASIAENSPTGTIVYQAGASDPDGDQLTWSLSGADASLFTIDANGAVRLVTAADYELRTGYSFNVVASDAVTNSARAVTLSVNDVADTTPIINETSAANNNTATAQAIDRGSLAAFPNAHLFDDDLPSVTVAGGIATTGDRDFFSITLQAGELLVLDVDGTTGGLDSLLRIYGPDGVEIGGNDDLIHFDPGSNPPFAHNTDSQIRFRAGTGGTYYFSIESFEADSSGNYRLHVSIGPEASQAQLIDEDVEALVSGAEWNHTNLSFGFPTLASQYPASFTEPDDGFAPFTAVQRAATVQLLQFVQNVSGLTFTQNAASPGQADLRYAMSNEPDVAYAYYPTNGGPGSQGGTAWFNHANFNNPVRGNYAWMGILHETGHALGLKHGHEFPLAIGADRDSLEYTVMTYRSYPGQDLSDGGYTNETWGFPQTLMMYDIAALQRMYGANFVTNAGDSVYTWSPTTGQMLVNGAGAGAPGGNRIFMTLWDGGGSDTYDLSGYSNSVTVDLRPGEWTTTGVAQLANLGDGHFARGNIANALLFEGDARSLIEKAVGGSGSDRIIANQAANFLTGGGGADRFQWMAAADSGTGGQADTILDFRGGTDRIDLFGIDADPGTANHDAFSFLGTGAFTLVAGEIRYDVAGGDAHILVDLDGDGAADMEIVVDGVTTLAASDFILSPVNAPSLANPVADQHRAEDAALVYQLPAGTFFDMDGDALAYGAALADGAPLPDWLSFDPSTRTFSGTPPHDFNGAIAVRVTAQDGTGSSSDVFELVIDPVNDAPAGSDAVLDMDEDGLEVLTAASFGFSDLENHAFAGVLFTAVSGGTLFVDTGNDGIGPTDAVTAFPILIPIALIDAGRVAFRPNADLYGDGAASIGFRVVDGGGTANGGIDTDPDVNSLTVDIAPVDDAAIARDDAVGGTATELILGSVFSDNGFGADSDEDGPVVTVTTVNGSAANVGTTILLPSGALLHIIPEGMFSYDANGAFDDLPAPSSGSPNSQAVDSFTYALGTGASATVRVTVRGVDGDDILLGGAGGIGDDTYYLDDGSDLAVEQAGEGRDIVYASVGYTLQAGSHVEVLSAASLGGTDPLHLSGNGLNNEVYGNAGVNVLRGGGGADLLLGGYGDDTYYVASGAETIFEYADQGRDIVYTSLNHALATGSHVEVLSAISLSGTDPLQLSGNELNNEVYGNAGANVLRGGGGTDLLLGGFGDDDYYITSGGETIFEYANEGRDIIYTDLSHTLAAGSHVEILSSISLASTDAINLGGNALDNIIYGNAGSNILYGGGGNDSLVGGLGDDTYYILGGNEALYESAAGGRDTAYAFVDYTLTDGAEVDILSTASIGGTEAIDLTGNEFGQEIDGNNGSNILDGKGGNDLLIGYGGADTFAFTSALGAGNVDQILDFSGGTDKIALDDAVFAGLTPGALPAGAFVTGSAAGDADDRIIYNSATGQLLFDADGSGGGAAVQFASVAPGTVLVASDFTII